MSHNRLICPGARSAVWGMYTAVQNTVDRLLAGLGVVLVLATVAVLIVYGGESDGATAQQAGPAKAVDQIDIKDFLYDPAAVTVPVGSTVTFTNRDSAPHTSTSGTSPSPDGMFDTGILKKNGSKAVKVTKAGTFDYYCELHPFMKATVTVK